MKPDPFSPKETLRSDLGISRRDLLVAGLVPFFPASSRADASEPPSQPPYDVCIVGSGFAGTYLALRLLELGARVSILEAGGPLGEQDPPQGSAQLLPVVGKNPLDFDFDDTRTIGVGGTSRRWNGVVSRLDPEDFRCASRYGFFYDWPLEYSDLEKHYCRAERDLSATGGALRSGAEPPRSCPYQTIRVASALPDGVFSEPAPPFVYIPFSTRAGRISALHLDEIEIQRFERSPRGKLLANRVVHRIITGSDGLVHELLAKKRDGSTESIRARCFVLASGVAETARLLLQSRSSQFPTGIGNRSDQVGRFFTAHLRQRLRVPVAPDLRPQKGIFRTYAYGPDFRSKGLGSVHVDLHLASGHATLESMVELEPRSENRVVLDRTPSSEGPTPLRLEFNYSERDTRTIARSTQLLLDLARELSTSPAALSELRTSWFHPAGTCRMAADAAAGVVDRDGRVFGTENLYVCGASTFPTAGSGNPTLTIVALALRLAEHLEGRLKRS